MPLGRTRIINEDITTPELLQESSNSVPQGYTTTPVGDARQGRIVEVPCFADE